MFLVKCADGCGAEVDAFGLRDEGWIEIASEIINGDWKPRKWVCNKCKNSRTLNSVKEEEPAAQEFLVLPELQKEFGFTRSENGSEKRYEKRITKVPKLKHTFWWLVHNAVAHPLIGFVPRRFAFEFHDWTSRKLHNQK